MLPKIVRQKWVNSNNRIRTELKPTKISDENPEPEPQLANEIVKIISMYRSIDNEKFRASFPDSLMKG